MVAQGFSHIGGIDYRETFSAFHNYESVRILLAFAAFECFIIHQMDISTAFLHGDIGRHIYMKQASGFADEKHPSMVWKLHKSLY